MGTHREDVDASDCRGVEIIKINQISTRVIFILSGKVYVTDKSKKYVYTTLGPGSCFGDVSLLLNEPNKYNYLFNEYSAENLFYLSVESLDFQYLCHRYHLTEKTLTQRAV